MLFRAPKRYTRKKLLIINGIGIGASMLLLFLCSLMALGISKMTSIDEEAAQQFFFGVFEILFILFVLNFFVVLAVDGVINLLTRFQGDYDKNTLYQQPVRFIDRNKGVIKIIARIIFFLSAARIFYQILFD
ncbi:hypothetical protein [Niabella soli]|uniref:hypothetical protein n=1 Tax=Niabella soli TaxID=446683 RepID=UPI00030099DE|nr:hypothetical protein [Niabella soli]